MSKLSKLIHANKGSLAEEQLIELGCYLFETPDPANEVETSGNPFILHNRLQDLRYHTVELMRAHGWSQVFEQLHDYSYEEHECTPLETITWRLTIGQHGVVPNPHLTTNLYNLTEGVRPQVEALYYTPCNELIEGLAECRELGKDVIYIQLDRHDNSGGVIKQHYINKLDEYKFINKLLDAEQRDREFEACYELLLENDITEIDTHLLQHYINIMQRDPYRAAFAGCYYTDYNDRWAFTLFPIIVNWERASLNLLTKY